jgi:hypothetical protein
MILARGHDKKRGISAMSDQPPTAPEPLPTKPDRRRQMWLGIAIGALVLIVGIGFFNASRGHNDSETSTDIPRMSLREFLQIQDGMSIAQVVGIVGGSGTLTADSSVAGYHDQILSWDGEGQVGANANVTFQNGLVVSKAQFGLG